MKKRRYHFYFVFLLLVIFGVTYYLNIIIPNNTKVEILIENDFNMHGSTRLFNIPLFVATSFTTNFAMPASPLNVVNRPQKVPINKAKKNDIAILIIACNRPTVDRIIKKSLEYRPSKESFPIIVSLDCNHEPTAQVIDSFGDEIIFMKHSNTKEIKLPVKLKNLLGYYLLSRHFKWALSQVFDNFNYQACIILEDDLDISPDLFEYFLATKPLLEADPSLWCVSAWNDNGKDQLIDSSATNMIYRTDFFPGLGWMLLKNDWLRFKNKWPEAFWDDWLRLPDQREGRTCLRPEISRTSTFGNNGVSRGQLYEAHLKHIHHFSGFVHFTKCNLSYLLANEYDDPFLWTVYGSRLISLNDFALEANLKQEKTLRIQYTTATFKKIANFFGIMDDVKSGMPRTAYRGIVTFMYKSWRIYLCQSFDWNGYDKKWV